MSDPTVPPVRYLFALRQFAAFAQVDLGELAVIADNVCETRFAAGALIAPGDAPLASLHLVLEGGIETRADRWRSRDVFGLLEVLAERPLGAPAIAARETTTLALAAADTREILEDNFGVLHAVIRGLVGRLVALDLGATPTVEIPSSSRLSLVERLMVLRQLAPFAGGRLHALAAVAQGCEEVVWPGGHALACAGHPADGFTIILDGSPKSTRPDHATTHGLRAGDTTGLLETIGQLRHPLAIETTGPTRLLRCSSANLIDVLEDHPDLGLAIVRNAATALLDAPRLEREVQPHVS
jgi:CRP-like cAMP-binding protein